MYQRIKAISDLKGDANLIIIPLFSVLPTTANSPLFQTDANLKYVLKIFFPVKRLKLHTHKYSPTQRFTTKVISIPYCGFYILHCIHHITHTNLGNYCLTHNNKQTMLTDSLSSETIRCTVVERVLIINIVLQITFSMTIFLLNCFPTTVFYASCLLRLKAARLQF